MKKFISVLASWALIFLPVSMQALPLGQQVMNGTVKFNTNANTMNIAASNKAIINYNSFNINHGEVVNFLQPSSNSVVLNRVIKANPSSIMGALNANGRVFLINPAGIVFGANSIVNTNSFLATTLDIKNTDFINGNYAFSQSQNKLPSYILQKGTITVSPEGFVVLASPLVKADGLIYAKTGKIQIGAVDNFYLNFDQSGLVKFDYQPKDSTKTDVLISNDVAQSLMQDVVNNKNLEEATNIVEENGVIKLVGGSGTALVSGKLNTDGDKAGSIGIVSQNYTALLDGAKLSSNANINGNGGNIYVYSDNNAYASKGASLLAKANQGNGGTIELSAKNSVLYEGSFVDTSSVNGEFGLFYIDPEYQTISSNINISSDYFSQATKSIVLDSGISINTNGGDITLEAPSITLNENSQLQAGTGDITLSANSVEDALIDIKDGVQINGANVKLAATSYKKSQFDSDSDDPLLNQLEAVGDFIIDMPSTPIAYKDATTTSKIDIGAVTINAVDSIDISSKATSDVSVSALFEILALSYGKSSATSSLHVNSGATLSSTGDITLKSEATSNNDVSGKATNILDNTDKQKQANFALSYSNTLTNSDAIVDSGVNITADNFKLLSTGNKDITTSATGQSLSAGTLGAAVAISDSKSNINSSLGGTINANSVEVSSTTNIERVKTSSSAGVGNGFVYKKILEPKADKATVIDKTKTLTDEKAPTTNSKSGVSKIALSAAFSYANQENNSEAKISSGAKVTSHGDVTVNSDIIYGRNGPYTQENGDVTIISDKGLKTIAIATVDSTDENTKENSFSGAVDITDVVNNSNAFIDDDAVVDAIGGKIGVYSSMYLGYLNLEWDNIKHFDGGIKDIASEAGAKVVDLVGFRGNLCTSLAQSNAQGTKNSLAGSFNIFKFTSNVDAHIGKNASINQNEGNGAVEVLANNDIQALNFAGVIGWTYFGTKAGSTAVGGSYLDVDYGSNTKAYIQNNTKINATDVKVAAIKNGKNISISTAGGSGKNAISGSFSSLNTDDNTYAYIDGATITTSDGINNKFSEDELDTNLRIDAQDNIAYIDGTGGIIKGKNVGIGLSGSLNIIKRDTQAYINNSTINRTSPSLGNLDYIRAYNGGSINTFAIAASVISPDKKESNANKSTDTPPTDASSATDTPPTDASLTDTKSTEGEEKGTFGFAVSGDASINKIEDKANAYIKGSTSIKGSQDVNILAKNDTNIEALSGSGALALKKKSAGLAGSYASNYFFNQANAYIQNATLNVNGVNIQAQNSGTISTISGSGSVSSGFTALAGSVSINEISNQTNSYIDDSTIALSKKLNLKSTDDTAIQSKAGALSASEGVGIGLSFAKNSIHNNLASYIQNSSLAVGDISISSYQDNSIKNIATSAGGSSGVLAAAGSTSINEIENSLDSYIFGSNIKSGDISIESLDESGIGSIAGSVSGASSVALGGAILYNKIANKLNSYVADASIQSKNLSVKSISDKDFTGITIGGAGAGTTSIAGGILINDIEDNTNAYVDGSTLNVDNSMIVHAIEQNKIITYGGALSGAGAVGIGGTVVRNKASNIVKAYIKNNSRVNVKGSGSLDIPQEDKKDYKETESFNGLSILALANEDMGVYTANASGAGTVAFAASANFNTISDSLDSYILNSSINQDNAIAKDPNQEVLVRAISNNALNINGGTLDGAGAVGIGGTLNNSYIQNKTHAYIDNSSLNAQKLIEVRAQSSEDTTSRTVGGSGAGTASLAGSVSLLHIANKNEADIDKGTTLLSQNDLNIISKDDAEEETLAGTLSGAGIAGVGGSVVVNSVKNNSIAHIDNSKASAKGKLYMYASNLATLKNTAGTGALGAFSAAGAIVFNTIDSTTKSYTSHDDGEKVLINQDPLFVADEQSVDIKAYDYAKVDDILGSVAGGLGAAGVSIDVSTLKNNTNAYLGKDTVLFAKKDLDIQAKSDKDFSAISLGGAGGVIGIGGSAIIANIGASIGDDILGKLASTKDVLTKTIDSLGNVVLGTSSFATNTKDDLDNEDGTMHDDSSFEKTTTKTNKTEAYIGSNAKVNAGNNLNINAENNILNFSIISGAGAAGVVGVGGAAALVYLGTDNSAYIDKGATANEGVTIDAKNLDIQANYDTGCIGIRSYAGAYAAVALGADYSKFVNYYTNKVMVGDDAFVVTTNGVNIKADTNEKTFIRGYGANDGAAAEGSSTANVRSSGTTNALVSQDSGISSGEGGTAIASSYSTNIDSQTVAAAGGVVDVAGSSSDIIIEPIITTEIENGARLRSNGDVKINTLLYDKLLSEAGGLNIGGISVGRSYARANNEAYLNTIIGNNVAIAAQNFYMMTSENINPSYQVVGLKATADKVVEGNALTALANSSVGTLIGGTGSEATTSNHSFLSSNIGSNSKINARDDIVIKTASNSQTSSTSKGAAYGVAAAGKTEAYTHNSGETRFELHEGSKLIASEVVFADSYAIRNAYATAFGGVGGLLGISGTIAGVDMGNWVSTRIDDGTKIVAYDSGDIFLLSGGDMRTSATSSTNSVGGITKNQVKSHVDINKQDISTYIGKSEIFGSWIFIRAMNYYLYADSNAYSKTSAVDSTSKSEADLDLVSNTGVVIDGSTITGYGKVLINADQRRDNIFAVTRAKSTIDAGLTGTLYSQVENNPTYNSSVVFKNNAKIQSDSREISAVAPVAEHETYTGTIPSILRWKGYSIRDSVAVWDGHYVKSPVVENNTIEYWIEKKVWEWLNSISLWKFVTEEIPVYAPSAGTEIAGGNWITNSNVLTSSVQALGSIDRDSPTITHSVSPAEAASAPSTVEFLDSPTYLQIQDYRNAVKTQQNNDFEAFNPSSISGQLNDMRNDTFLPPIPGGGDETTGLLEGAGSAGSEESKVSFSKSDIGNYNNIYVSLTSRELIRMYKNEKFVIIDNRILGGRLLERYTRMMMFEINKHIVPAIFKVKKYRKKDIFVSSI